MGPVAYLSATYGRSPSSRARLTAVASWDWWRRHAPVTRDERILPLSLIARRERREVLVVDDVDLVPAERARA